MNLPLLTVVIKYEHDVPVARQRARQIAALLEFDVQDQTRIGTAVSEIARNAFRYGGGGKLEFSLEGSTPPQVFLIRISDQGLGIAQLEQVLSGEYHSTTGMGLGLVGARRLMDQFHIESHVGGGTTVWLRKLCPKRAPLITAQNVMRIIDALMSQQPQSPAEEFQQQNQELLRTLEELHRRQDELLRLNQELEDTNRGVVALYAELDERADYLRRADELKTRFLSNMSHEFRTPLNSILALSRLLLDHVDGQLNEEQTKQVHFIRNAAEGLSELVNDLLDLAKVEAGKTVVRPAEFDVGNLFGALRSMLRPLLISESLNLVFEEPVDVPPLYSDEGKVSQILRNFISNALKFTERGEVRISAKYAPETDTVVFSVADTGIGIAPEDQEHVFQEFAQLEHPLQRRVKGTGLGLPLSRKLAELLGGGITLQSTPGVGSTFSLVLPLVYSEFVPSTEPADNATLLADARLPVLIVEDAAADMLLYEKYLKGTPYKVVPARTVREAREWLKQLQPVAIVLDILLRGDDSWLLLADLKKDPDTAGIPVLVVTTLDDQHKALGLGADAYLTKPIQRPWLLSQLDKTVQSAQLERLLIIDDDAGARYILRALLSDTPYQVIEAASGPEGLQHARRSKPRVIFLDLVMPQVSGYETLEQLKADPATRDIPVIIITSRRLTEAERGQLAAGSVEIFSKDLVTRPDARALLMEALAHVLPPGPAIAAPLDRIAAGVAG